MKKLLSIFATYVFFILSSVNIVAAQSAGTPLQDNSPLCDGGKGINTALGCIPAFNQSSLIAWILSWALGIGGGIAFLLIGYAAFTLMTSQGNPDRIKAGQELLTSAIAGIIMLIFSVFILRFIGVDILGVFK